MYLRRGLGQTYFEWNTKTAWAWVIPNILYVFMLSTSVFVLQYLNVHMVTVFKNITLILIALGDSYFFNAKNGPLVQVALGLMFLGSLLAGITDLEFNPVGYFWMAMHILSQAAYVLYVRKVKKSINMPEEQMVYYNNLLSLPFFLILAFLNGEYERAENSDSWEDNGFLIVWVVSGLMGMFISLASFYCMNIAGPTTFAIVGSINKIPLTILGIFIFHVQLDWKNVTSVSFAIVAATIYSKAKYDEGKGGKH
jgi:GDP-mannose transporter